MRATRDAAMSPLLASTASVEDRRPSRLLDALPWLGLGSLACLAMLAACLQRLPVIVGARAVLTWGVLLGSTLGLAAAARLFFRRRSWIALALGGLFLTAFGLAAARELRLAWLEQRVLGAPADELRRRGVHFIVGYRDYNELAELARHGAVAGVYLTRRNVQDQSAADVAGCIGELQEMRRLAGLPPLLVVADQEGGPIEHLSPPLPMRPSLADIAGDRDASELRQAVLDHARAQARDLKGIGITLNLAPVVDLRTEVVPRIDLFSHIRSRAIDGDPQRVAQVALAYCQGLASQGVGCTLKHLPGLGKSAQDAHFFLARLDLGREELMAEDLAPYAALARNELPVAFMATHVVVPQIDQLEPASLSAPMLTGLVRRSLRFDGLLLSDDLSMLPIALGPGGVRRAACAGLNAGLDLLLLSYDTDLYYEAMAAVLDGCDPPISAEQSATSGERILRFQRLASARSEPGP